MNLFLPHYGIALRGSPDLLAGHQGSLLNYPLAPALARMRCKFSGLKKLSGGIMPSRAMKNWFVASWFPSQGRLQLLLVGRRRREPREIEIHSIVRHRSFVAPLLVLPQRCVERACSRQPLVDCLNEEFGVAKGVADAQRQIGILVAAGIADQGPSGTVGSAHKVRQVGARPKISPRAVRPGRARRGQALDRSPI